MAHSGRMAAMPVVLLYNLEPSWPAADREEVESEVARLCDALAAAGRESRPTCLATPDVAAALAGAEPENCVVFNWCDALPGLPHSEALVAQRLESLGFTHTGSPPKVLELSWRKEAVKACLAAAGVPTPAWEAFCARDLDGWSRFPAIVKAAHEHASLGLGRESVVTDRRELAERVAQVVETLQQPALVEDFIDGREFHVTVWGNGTLAMLPPAEMDFAAMADPRERLCSYDAKFTPGSPAYEKIQLVVPAPLTEAERAELERVTTAAYRAVGCRDYARIDVRLRDGVFYVLDVNPNCDLSTETSTAFAAAVAEGSFGRFLSRLVDLAQQRHPRWREVAHG